MSRQFKAARLNIKMTTAEACEKIGIAQPTLSAWENGKKTPSVEAIERMADLYGVSTDYLLGDWCLFVTILRSRSAAKLCRC